jgi:hypothetical protein
LNQHIHLIVYILVYIIEQCICKYARNELWQRSMIVKFMLF